MSVTPLQGQAGDEPVVVDAVKQQIAADAAKQQIAADAVKQQVDLLAHWSRFYHDAEIKVNSASIAISAIAAIGDKIVPGSAIVSVHDKPFNIIGFFIAIVSASAFLSTLGYWRYYEMCDLLGKTYRKRILPDDIDTAIKAEFKKKFEKAYPRSFGRFGRVWDHLHHLVWLVSQVILFGLGVYLAFNSNGRYVFVD